MLDFQREVRISGVTLVPRYNGYGFPSDFVLQYSNDGVVWTNVEGQKYAGYPNPKGTKPQVFEFETPINARYLRILATKLTTDDYGIYYFQLAEIEVNYHQ